jgi:hypothetical protein
VSLPPFDWSREREEYPNDRSVETTVSILAFFRRLTVSYSRPMRGAR